MKIREFQVGGRRIFLLPVIKGLKSEIQAVKNAFDYARPGKVAISVSPEDLQGLRQMPADYVPELSRYEELYAELLSRYGDVAAPPPAYIAAVELADHMAIPIVPVDLDEVSYTALYCAAVTGTTLFRHSTRLWLLRRRGFPQTKPEDFVLAWDRRTNNMRGFMLIEEKRAKAMAEGILGCAKGIERLLAIVELERAGQVSELLEASIRKG
jgi:hypothetical protein